MRVSGLVALLLLAGCSGGASDPGGEASQTGQAGRTVDGLPGLRGVRVASSDCAVSWPDPSSKTAQVTGAVLGYTVCGSSPRPHDPRGVKLPLRGTVQQYTAAFAREDVRPQGAVSCLDYADAIPNVIVRTSTGYWSLHVPLDACNHLQPAVKRLVTAPADRQPD